MNKQKLSIWKPLKLNEDFFDDKESDIYDETGFDLENGDNQQYTYHFQFIFYIWPLIKEIDKKSKTATLDEVDCVFNSGRGFSYFR